MLEALLKVTPATQFTQMVSLVAVEALIRPCPGGQVDSGWQQAGLSEVRQTSVPQSTEESEKWYGGQPKVPSQGWRASQGVVASTTLLKNPIAQGSHTVLVVAVPIVATPYPSMHEATFRHVE
jgi:hypothetical protein